MVILDDSPFYYTYGIGFDFDKQFTPKTNAGFEVGLVIKDYREDAGRSTARDENGTEYDMAADISYQAMDHILLTTSAGYTNLDTEISFYRNTEFSFGLGAIVTYASPDNIDTGPWSTSLSSTVLYRRYHVPNPSVGSFKKRKDTEIRTTLLTSVPVTDEWSMTTSLAHTVVDSNFKNYIYTNWAMAIGVSRRF